MCTGISVWSVHRPKHKDIYKSRPLKHTHRKLNKYPQYICPCSYFLMSLKSGEVNCYNPLSSSASFNNIPWSWETPHGLGGCVISIKYCLPILGTVKALPVKAKKVLTFLTVRFLWYIQLNNYHFLPTPHYLVSHAWDTCCTTNVRCYLRSCIYTFLRSSLKALLRLVVCVY